MSNHRARLDRIAQQAAEILETEARANRRHPTPIELLLGAFGVFRENVIAHAQAIGGASLAEAAEHAFRDVPDNPIASWPRPRHTSDDHARQVMIIAIDADDRARTDDPATYAYLFGGLGADYEWPADPLDCLARRLGDRLPTAEDSPGTWLGWARANGARDIPRR